VLAKGISIAAAAAAAVAAAVRPYPVFSHSKFFLTRCCSCKKFLKLPKQTNNDDEVRMKFYLFYLYSF
jgi:hypothetical protein